MLNKRGFSIRVEDVAGNIAWPDRAHMCSFVPALGSFEQFVQQMIILATPPGPCRRVDENKHSNRGRSMTYTTTLSVKCSHSLAYVARRRPRARSLYPPAVGGTSIGVGCGSLSGSLFILFILIFTFSRRRGNDVI